MTRTLILYDLPDDRQRYRLSRLLEAYGERVQGSVFECLITPTQTAQLIQSLQGFDLGKGSIRLYRICGRCEPHRLVWGTAKEVEDPPYYLV